MRFHFNGEDKIAQLRRPSRHRFRKRGFRDHSPRRKLANHQKVNILDPLAFRLRADNYNDLVFGAEVRPEPTLQYLRGLELSA